MAADVRVWTSRSVSARHVAFPTVSARVLCADEIFSLSASFDDGGAVGHAVPDGHVPADADAVDARAAARADQGPRARADAQPAAERAADDVAADARADARAVAGADARADTRADAGADADAEAAPDARPELHKARGVPHPSQARGRGLRVLVRLPSSRQRTCLCRPHLTRPTVWVAAGSTRCLRRTREVRASSSTWGARGCSSAGKRRTSPSASWAHSAMTACGRSLRCGTASTPSSSCEAHSACPSGWSRVMLAQTSRRRSASARPCRSTPGRRGIRPACATPIRTSCAARTYTDMADLRRRKGFGFPRATDRSSYTRCVSVCVFGLLFLVWCRSAVRVC